MGFEVILPFLRPIEHLILDADVSEIMVNGSVRVFIERHGQIEEAQGYPSLSGPSKSPSETSPGRWEMRSARRSRCSTRVSPTAHASRR